MFPAPHNHDIVNQRFAFSYSVVIKTCCNFVVDKHMLALENHASYSVLFCNRGIISFGNKSYILEPLQGATSEHKIYRAENLKIAPGSCGHQLDISAVRAAGDDTSHRSQAGRVGGWGTWMFLACESVSGNISVSLPTKTLHCRVPALQNIIHVVKFRWCHVLKIVLKIEHIYKSSLLFLDPVCVTCFFTFFVGIGWHRKVYGFILW